MAAIPEKERYVILPAGPRKDYGGAETRALNLASPRRPEGEQGPLVLTDTIRLDYAAQCLTHTQFFRADSYSAARRYARHPYLFCAACQDAITSANA